MTNQARMLDEWRTLRAEYPVLTSWTLQVDRRSTRRAGACHYRPRKITMSAWHVTHSSWDQVRNTLRHEVAHVLAGPFAGHGDMWKREAIRVGAVPKACFSQNDEGMNMVLPWRCLCPVCGDLGGKSRRPKNANIPGYRYCRRCKSNVTYVHSPAGKPITTPTPIGLPIAAHRPITPPKPTPISKSDKTFTYGCIVGGTVRCTNGIGARERKMGIAMLLRKLPMPMTKIEATRFLKA
jgi:predicted SprT family Zn-dependent metalloprotease